MKAIVRSYSGDQAYLQAVDGINNLFDQGYLTQAEAARLVNSINSKLKSRGVDATTI